MRTEAVLVISPPYPAAVRRRLRLSASGLKPSLLKRMLEASLSVGQTQIFDWPHRDFYYKFLINLSGLLEEGMRNVSVFWEDWCVLGVEAVWAMALIILTALCLLGCGFMLYVLLHWIQDTHPSVSSGSGHDGGGQRERPQLHLVASRTTASQQGSKLSERARKLSRSRTGPRQSEAPFHCAERIAHQRIAKSLIHRKRA